MTQKQFIQLYNHYRDTGEKLQAVKLVRICTGLNLKQSKELADAYILGKSLLMNVSNDVKEYMKKVKLKINITYQIEEK